MFFQPKNEFQDAPLTYLNKSIKFAISPIKLVWLVSEKQKKLYKFNQPFFDTSSNS